MTITVELPDDVASHAEPGREALEALAIAGFKSGALTGRATRLLLGFETRYELDGFLKANQVSERSYGVDDYAKDLESIRKMDELGKIKR